MAGVKTSRNCELRHTFIGDRRHMLFDARKSIISTHKPMDIQRKNCPAVIGTGYRNTYDAKRACMESCFVLNVSPIRKGINRVYYVKKSNCIRMYVCPVSL